MILQPKNSSMSVDIKSGAFKFHTVDLVIPAKGFDFRFERWHNSTSAFNQLFRGGWQFDWDERLEFDPVDGSVRYWTPGLRMRRFVRNPDGTYTAAVAWTYSTLTRRPDGHFEITLKNQGKRVFDGVTGRLLRREDTNGNFQTFSWPFPSVPGEIRDSAGRIVTVVESVVSGLSTITVTDWVGRTLKYEMDNSSALTAYVDPEGNRCRYTANTQGINFVGLESITLPNGLWVTNYPFGPKPQETMVGRQVYGNGREIVYQYDQANYRTTVIDGGREWFYQWNSHGELLEKRDPLGNVWLNEYDANHNLIKTTFPNLTTIEKAYDDKGNLVWEKDQKGSVRRYQYDPTYNQLVLSTAPAPFGYVKANEYDPATGNLIESGGTKANLYGAHAYGSIKYGYDPSVKTIYEHYADGLLKKVTDPNGNSQEFGYDVFGNPKWIKNGLGKVTNFEVDLVGNRVAVIDPLGNKMRMGYDKLNRVVSTTTPLGHTRRFRFDGNGNTVWACDPLNRTTRFQFSVMNELLATFDAAGGKVGYSYDLFHNVLEQVDPNGHAYAFAYDILDRVTKVTDPMGQETLTDYDPFCGTSRVTDANGDRTSYVHDVACLLTMREFEDHSFFQYFWDGLGRRVRMTQPQQLKYGEFLYGAQKYGYDPADDTTFTWDENGRLIKVSYPGGNHISMGYDLAGRLVKLTDIHDVDTTYGWDAANRLISVMRAGKTTAYIYDDANRVTQFTYPNGVTCDFNYDNDSRILRMLWKKGVTALYDIQYWYDGIGNRIRRSRTEAFSSPVIEDFSYDALSRLTDVRENGALRSHYRFDLAGNRVLKRTTTDDLWSNNDASGEVLNSSQVGFRWDNMGQLLERQDSLTNISRYEWSAACRLGLVALPDDGEIVYRYNGDGLRIYRNATSGEARSYFWVPSGILGLGHVLNEVGPVGESVSYVVGPLGMIAVINGGEESYFVVDAIGSVLALTDEAGSVSDVYCYDEYGVPGGPSLGMTYNPLRFAGQSFDLETGLYYMRSRYYSPDMGVFLSRDSARLINRYSYADSNPVRYVDPTGLAPSMLPLAVQAFQVMHYSFVSVYFNIYGTCHCLSPYTAAAEAIVSQVTPNDFELNMAWSNPGISVPTSSSGTGYDRLSFHWRAPLVDADHPWFLMVTLQVDCSCYCDDTRPPIPGVFEIDLQRTYTYMWPGNMV